MHSRIVSRFETLDEKKAKFEKHISTAGRFLLSSIIPKNINNKFSLIDRLLPKIVEVIDHVFRFSGQKALLFFVIN